MERWGIRLLLFVVALALPGFQCPTMADSYEIVYEPHDGTLRFHVPPSLPHITALMVKSEAGVFTGERPVFDPVGLFDVFQPHQLFRLNPAGFGTKDFGPVMTPGLESDFLASDLCADGARVGGGYLGGVLFGEQVLPHCFERPTVPPPHEPGPPSPQTLDFLPGYAYESPPYPASGAAIDLSSLVQIGDMYATIVDVPDELKNARSVTLPTDLAGDDRIRFKYEGELTTLIMAIESQLEQPVSWMNDTSLTNLPAAFHLTGETLQVELSGDDAPDRFYTLWATPMRSGEYALPFIGDQMILFVDEPKSVPEPTSDSLIGLSVLLLARANRRRRISD